MRIGMILDKIFPPDPRVENEALALISSGHEVFLFCIDYNQATEEQIKGIKVKRYLSSRLEYKLSALSYTLPYYKKMMSKKINHFLTINKIDIIHVHDMVVAEAAIEGNKVVELPLILDLHENRPEIMKTYPHLRKFPGNLLISTKGWKQKEGELVRKYDKTIVVTKEAKAELIDRLGVSDQKIVVVPNTVKRAFYQDFKIDQAILKRYEGKFVILYLGDTGLRRGLLSVIEALEILARDKQLKETLKLVIVGRNSTDDILKQKVKALGIQEMVDFEGWQEEALFPSYLEAANVGVSPLHRNLHHDTTYANKLFQYMSFALPVLVSDAKAQKNLVEKVTGGLVHKEKDSKEIASKILTLFQEPDLTKKMGLNGKKFIQDEFCWEKVSGNLKNLYLEFEKS